MSEDLCSRVCVVFVASVLFCACASFKCVTLIEDTHAMVGFRHVDDLPRRARKQPLNVREVAEERVQTFS